MTNLKTEVQAEIGLASSGTEDTLLTIWLNRAVRDVLRRTHCYVDTLTITESAGTSDYTLSAAIIAVKSFRWDSADGSTHSYPERVPLTEIERLRAASDSVSSQYPAAYYAVTGTKLSVWPTPSAADTITAWYVPKPTEMSSGSHDTSNATYGGIPEEYTDAIVLYAEWKASSYRNNRSPDQIDYYRQRYEDECKRIRKDVVGKGGRLGRAVLHPSRRRFPVANDRYPAW